MIVKLLGGLDFLAGLIFLLFEFTEIIPYSVVVYFGLFLIVKGALFGIPEFNVISIIDIVCGILFLLSFFGMFNFIVWIVSIYLLQKGLFSFISFN